MSKQTRATYLMLITSLIWGFAFVAQRASIDHLGSFSFNTVRFTLGAVVIALIGRYFDRGKRHKNRPIIPYTDPYLLKAGLVCGLILFIGASSQQFGVKYTSAGKAGFITGMYVIFTPIFGIFIGHRTNKLTWIGATLATLGLYLLSVREDFTIARGDLILLASAVMWTLHVLAVAHLSLRTDPIKLAVWQNVITIIISAVFALSTETITLDGLRQAALPILYSGTLSVGVGYMLQIISQRDAHPSHAAIIFSLESLFAAFGGWLILHEQLSTRALWGCAFMLLGMIISQLPTSYRST